MAEEAKYKTTKVGMGSTPLQPGRKEIEALTQTALTPEAAEYAVARFKLRLGENETTKPVIVKLEEFARNVRGVFDGQAKGGIWTGKQEPLSEFSSLQKLLADKSLDQVKEIFQQAGLLDENGQLNGELELDFAVNDEAQFVRAYKINGKPVTDKALVELLDDTFKAWLAEKGMFYKNGQLYDVDKSGKIKQENGHEKLMDKEDIFDRLQDGKQGFAAELDQKGINAKVVRRDFPSKQTPAATQTAATAGTAQSKQQVQNAIKSGIEVEGGVKTADAVVEEADSPEQAASTGPSSSGGGGGGG